MSSSSRAWLRLAGAMLAIGLLAALAAAIHEAGATRERLVWQGREAQRNAAAAEAYVATYAPDDVRVDGFSVDPGPCARRRCAWRCRSPGGGETERGGQGASARSKRGKWYRGKQGQSALIERGH